MIEALQADLPITLAAFAGILGFYFLVAVPLWRLGRYARWRVMNPLNRFDRWAENLGREKGA